MIARAEYEAAISAKDAEIARLKEALKEIDLRLYDELNDADNMDAAAWMHVLVWVRVCALSALQEGEK